MSKVFQKILNNSINYVLGLVGESLETSMDALIPVNIHNAYPYDVLERLVMSMFFQIGYLENQHMVTFYTLNTDYLCAVVRDGEIMAFVYGLVVGDGDQEDMEKHEREILDSMCNITDKGCAVRFHPIMDGIKWKEHVDPSLILTSGLPYKFHPKTVFYSVAVIVEQLFKKDVDLLNNTKLGGFIKRNKIADAAKRIVWI